MKLERFYKLHLFPVSYAGLLLLLFAGLAANPMLVPKPAPKAIGIENPAWKRAGNNIAACCSVNAYERALPLMNKRLDMSDYDDLTFMGNFYRDWCNWEESVNYYNQALAAAEKKQDKRRMGIAENNLGLVYYLEADTQAGAQRSATYKESRDALDRALTLAREVGDSSLEATVKGNLDVLAVATRT